MVGRIGLNPLPRWVNVIWGKTANAWLDVVWPTGAGLSKDHRLIYPGGLRPIRPTKKPIRPTKFLDTLTGFVRFATS
jgi:hypothetical protein